MSIEEYVHGKVSPMIDAEGNSDITKEKAKDATTALHKDIKNKETKGTGAFSIEGDDEVHEVMKENFETSLNFIERDIAKLVEMGNDLNNNNVQKEKLAFIEHTYIVDIDSIDARLKSMNNAYKKDPFPEMLGRLNDALSMVDSLKVNQLRLKLKNNQN